MSTSSSLFGIVEKFLKPIGELGRQVIGDDRILLDLVLAYHQELATLIRESKRDSSKWVKENESKLQGFHWQAGYGAFSVSPSHVEALVRYIKNQEEHHRTVTFQEEFRRICKKYGVEIDERYVWD